MLFNILKNRFRFNYFVLLQGILLFCLAVFFVLWPGRVAASTWQVLNESTGLCGNQVNCYASFKTVMAVGTDHGVSVYSGETGSWASLALPDAIASTPVKDIAFDEYGHMWLATCLGLISVQGKQISIYGAESKIPTVDIDRVQIKGNQIFIGCFGGYVARAFVPQSGMTSFIPVNYDGGPDAGGFKIKSVGVSGLAMIDSNRGWIGTRGGGLIEINGSSEFPANGVDGQPESWINDFYIFEGSERNMHTLLATPEHLSLIKNGNAEAEVRLPIEDPWINCVVAVKEPEELFEVFEQPKMSDDDRKLFDFLPQRSLFIGTRNNGLWQFQKGKWVQHLTTNSSLPSDCINRLYIVGRLLVVCTDAGLVLVHLDSNYYDEFKKEGIGNHYAKTIYAVPPSYARMQHFFQIVRGNSFWFTHEQGLTRWKSSSFPKNFASQSLHDVSSRLEPGENEKPSEFDDSEPELPVDSVGEEALRGYWQLFTKEYMFYDEPEKATDLFEIPYQKITWMTVDKNTDYLWVIFEGRHLMRMRMKKKVVSRDGRKQKIEVADWQKMNQFVPWADGTQLNVVWFSKDRIYVGTKGSGFYILSNPGSENQKKDPFQWVSYDVFTGLPDSDVRGFTLWNSAAGERLTILHPQGITVWDGEFFNKLDLGGIRTYTCIDSGAEGNLWIGSMTGLFRVTPEGSVLSYSSANAFFESNKITAVGALPLNTAYSLGVWVACDELAHFAEPGRILNGSDQPPFTYKDASGTIRVIESDIDYSSLHFFDGLTWDKWKVAGIKNIFVDRDYIWLTSNLRVRRLLVPR